ncbi:MAG: tRNA (N6-isopentenyl adenosine(37)-C2)-methylthiotransferase MiaB [Verrucomicrobia bacterium GWF2_51_19]|nr:MAG: tRNA (N6-isopentenyl adenosine(37)-C2)-methylthiotransferase MiaB [Verrucomicrobia bacterium GWF2_51_19]
MNERDSESVAALLVARGYVRAGNEDSADIVLLNTCSVREVAEQKAIGKACLLLNRRGSNKVVGIMGCMAQNRGEALLETLPDLDLIVGTQQMHRIPDFLEQGESICALEEEVDSQNALAGRLDTPPSAFVSIMQGCNMGCSYCIVPKTRGRELSRPITDIVAEVQQLAQSGTKEVTLLGQIVTSYGLGSIAFQNKQSPFVQLLRAIEAIDGIKRIRFTSPHPSGFRADLIEAFGELNKLCPNVHLPLQSGSDKILKAMKRPYTVSKYRDIVDRLKTSRTGICFSTDIIVGFPGENEEDFQATLETFDAVGFDMAYLFKYSLRTGTPAEVLGDPIPEEEKERRNQVLIEKLAQRSLASHRTCVGQSVEVLVEGPAKRGNNRYWGRTPEFKKVFFDASNADLGQLLTIEIESATTTCLLGQQVSPIKQ